MNRLLMPIAAGFRMGVALRTAAYRRGWLTTRRLSRPVVSVGNLSVGGTGKTPFVAYLAELLMKQGWKPSILTRGYGRRKGAKLVAIDPGASRAPDPGEVGDEPALLARKLPAVPVVVCADRYRAGLLAEEKFGVDVHILDDGFQHFALVRDVDIVLLDATQVISNRAMLPSGRLREPPAGLERAHLVALTRTELADPKPMEDQIQQINPRAGVFRCATKLRGLVNVASGTTESIESAQAHPAYAFCGLGNPSAFFADLKKWGFSVRDHNSFPDHHAYRQGELARLSEEARKAGAKVLLTTEKDGLNLPSPCETEIPVLACVIQTEILEADAFEKALIERLGTVRVNA